MSTRLIIPQVAGGLGDWLSLTPALRAARIAGRDPLVLAPDSPHTRQFATLYQRLAEVQFLPAGHPDLRATPETNEPTCFSLRIMRALGLTGSPIPYVEVTTEEREDAASLLVERTGGILWSRDLVAIAPSPGGARAEMPDEHIANYRRWPADLLDSMVERLHDQGCQPVRFGTRTIQTHIYANNQTHIPGVLDIPDLTLRQLAACYAVIGRLVSTDTGDRHVMLAAGGIVDLWVPEPTWFYRHEGTLYGPDAWALAGENPRERHHVYPRGTQTIVP